MTLTTQSTKAVAQGNGATTSWPFTFLIPAIEDLVVTLVDVASGNPTVIAPVNYSTTGLSNPNGGSITYPLSGAPLTAATFIVVERFVPDIQETDLTNQGGAYPADIEDALDYLTMITQQLQDQIDRSIVFSVADTSETTLPTALARANKSLTFNSNGDPIASDGLTPGTTVSAAMIPVVTAATTALALTALGLPGALLDLLIPSGTCWEYNAGGTAPTGFVFPIGQACTGTYPNYRAKLIAAGSPYGTNGADPLMPDRRSTVAAGKSNMGGVNNGLLSGGTVLGAVFGSQTITLSVSTIPSHGHPVFAGIETHTHVVSGGNGAVAATTAVAAAGHAFADVGAGIVASAALTGLTVRDTAGGGGTANQTATTGGGASHDNVQPTFICNFILKVH